jgi:hypothetical protein
MGHPPEDVMCIAIDGENPTWINATVTTKQIRKVFAHEPCLACVIDKRNHDSGRYLYRLKHKDDKPDKDLKPTDILKPENEKSDQDPKPTIIDEEVIIDASKIDLHVHPLENALVQMLSQLYLRSQLRMILDIMHLPMLKQVTY